MQCLQDAGALGVNVVPAKRVLKVIQGLESAMIASDEGPSQYQVLKAKIEAAEHSGVNSSLIQAGRNQLAKCLLVEVRTRVCRLMFLCAVSVQGMQHC